MSIKKDIIRYFNQGATTYDTEAALQATIAQQLAARANTHFPSKKSPQKILEIGCGTGLLSQYMLRSYPFASFLLTDIAYAMVNLCNKRFTHEPHIQAICLDGESFALQERFDLIISSMALHWFEELPSSINTIIQHLTPGGCFLFSALGKNSLHEWRTWCKSFDIQAATLPFIDHDEMKYLFPNIQYSVENIQYPYTNAQAFLYSLKQLGARAPRGDATMAPLSKLRPLLRHYSSPISISYEVIYGCYTI